MGIALLSANSVSTVVSAMGDVLGLVTEVVSVMMGEPLLLFFLAAGLVPVGIGLFRRLKGAARG